MRVKILKIGGEWKVQFSYGNQFFTLEYGGSKAEAEWMAKQLKKCFADYKVHSIKKK